MDTEPSGADDLFWFAAICEWKSTGKTTAIEHGLRYGRPIPQEARNFIADIITGKAKHADQRKLSVRVLKVPAR